MAAAVSDNVVWLIVVFALCLLSGTMGYYLAYRVYHRPSVSRHCSEEEQLTALPAVLQYDSCVVEVGTTSTVKKFHNSRHPCNKLLELRQRGTKRFQPCRICFPAKED